MNTLIAVLLVAITLALIYSFSVDRAVRVQLLPPPEGTPITVTWEQPVDEDGTPVPVHIDLGEVIVHYPTPTPTP